jgi:16S rRNA (guanine527-N7)-methyltransferase
MSSGDLEEIVEQTLGDAIRAANPELGSGQVDRLVAWRDLMFEINQKINLTAIRDRELMGQRLVLESLRLVDPLRQAIGLDRDPRVLDLGTGGGVPGVVLAIAFPDIPFVLLDATGKKLAAVASMAKDLGLRNVETLHARGEDAAHDTAWRSSFTVVTARAVSSIPALIELGLPFLKLHGTLLLPKGLDVEEEVRVGVAAAKIVGGNIASQSILAHNGSHIDTTLVIVEKTRVTPATYPRRSGLPSRQPLGT